MKVFSDILGEGDLGGVVEAAVAEGRRVFDVILEKKLVEEPELLGMLAKKLGYVYEEIDRATLDFKIAHLVSEEFARNRTVLPLPVRPPISPCTNSSLNSKACSFPPKVKPIGD